MSEPAPRRRGLGYADAHGRGTTDGEAVLERLSFGGSSVRGTLINQGRISLFYYWCTFCILRARRPRYQRLLPPLPGEPGQLAPSLVKEAAAAQRAAM